MAPPSGASSNGTRRVEQVGPARFAHVGGDAEDEPQRVVVEAVADLGIAAARQRLVLVIGAAVALLRGREVHEPRAHLVRHHVHDAEAVLVRVAEADAAAAAGLEQRRAARELERHHALVGIPGVDEVVEPRIGRAHLQGVQPRVPAAAMRGKGALGVSRILEPGTEPARGGEIGLAVARPLVVELVLGEPGREDELGGFAGPERDGDGERRDRPPAADAGIARAARAHGGRVGAVAVGAEEGAAVGVEAVHGTIHEVKAVVGAPLPVAGDVADRRAVDQAFRQRQVALQVRGVVLGVPLAPFDVGEHAHGFRRGRCRFAA